MTDPSSVSVITGAGSGFGLALAQECANQGLAVALLDLDGDRAVAEAARLTDAGADAFLEFLIPALADAVTVHQGHMPEIELTSASSATGVWALQDTIWWADGSVMYGYGHYHETYDKGSGEWRIKRSKLTRLNTVFTSVTE